MELDAMKKDIKYVQDRLDHIVAVQAQLFSSMENAMSSTSKDK
jgi:hypothetical protein